jgi:hypothetical protein
MIRELKDKMIELRTRDLQQTGEAEVNAACLAQKLADTVADLHARALIATGIRVTYDKPRDVVAELADANPGANIKANGDGSFTADVPGLKFPVTPPRPTIQFLPHGKFDMTTPEDELHETLCGCEDLTHGDEQDVLTVKMDKPWPGPTPPEEGVAMPGYPDRQELEDKLRIIADIIDGQPSFGTDLANFKRRLQRVL